MAKQLQTRSKTIRRAIGAYNKAAQDLERPRPSLKWDDVSHYGLVEQYALLKASDTTLDNEQWSKPIHREILKCRHRIARAREELTRCNIETRRLHTGIYDETVHFKKVLRGLKDDGGATYEALKDYAVRRTAVNKALLKRVRQIHSLVGFTGDSTRGVRAGIEHNHDDDGGGDDGDDDDVLDLRDEEDGEGHGDQEHEDDVENDIEFHGEMDGIGAFFTNTTRD